MPEPIISAGAFLLGVVGGAVSNVISGRAEQHIITPFLERYSNHDVQKSIQEAWKQTCNDLFKHYRDSDYPTLSHDDQTLVDERALLFIAPATLEHLFGTVDNSNTQPVTGDMVHIFMQREVVNRQLIAKLKKLWFWEGLPSKLQAMLRSNLLDSLLFNFVEIAIKRDPKARDALFFQQFIVLRQMIGKSKAEQAALWGKVVAALEGLEGYQRWQCKVLNRIDERTERIDETSTRTEAKVEGLVYQVAEVGVNIQSILPLLEEIVAYVRGASTPSFTIQGSHLVAEHGPASVMLRERQINYLERHRLFAGRDKEMARIHDFLKTQRKGYIFVTGPSGYGKTALLANLIAPHRERYAWYFLNQLDNAHRPLDFLRQMCEQLLVYYGMPVQSEADLPQEIDRLEALYAKLLRMPLVRAEQPLVMVIDGVDEAEGNFINDKHIPRELPEGKFIVFSARQTGRDYLSELGLPQDNLLPIKLDTLDQAGIKALLQQAGRAATAWADDPALVAQVQRVSGGDPFYLRYLTEDIAKGSITSAQIKNQPSGLETYLDGWWQQVVADVRRKDKDKDLRDLMGILMVAHGPLPHDDLFHLYPELEWSVDDILRPDRPVRRFVVVEQVAGQVAYALCHPRFRDYLTGHKLRTQAATYRQQLLDYCAGWQEHHSLYALRHYAGHLADVGRWEDLHTLVTTGEENRGILWAEARHAAEGSYTGYLADLALIWTHADDVGLSDPESIGRQVRYALIESTMHSVAANIPEELLVALVKYGVWTLPAGLDYVRQIPNALHRVQVFIFLATELPEPDRTEVLRKALAEAPAFKDKEEWADALVRLVPNLPEPERTEVLHETLAKAQADEIGWRHALECVALRFAEAGDADQTLILAQILKGTWTEVEALATLIPHLSEPKRTEVLQQTLAAVRKHRAEADQTYERTLAKLALHLSGLERIEVLHEILRALQRIRDEGTQSWTSTIPPLDAPASPLDVLYAPWYETLHVLTTRTRRRIPTRESNNVEMMRIDLPDTRASLLSDLEDLSPIIAALGGTEALEATAEAIVDVGRWYP